MDLVTYIDHRFQEASLEASTKTQLEALKLDAEAKALNQVLTGYRTLLKWLQIPLVFFGFWRVALGLKTAPEPVLVQKMKRDQAAAKAVKELLKDAKDANQAPAP